MSGVGYLAGDAEGAYPIGSRIVKVRNESELETPVGTRGTVVASHYVGDVPPPAGTPKAEYFYFVEWEDKPGLPVGVIDWKIGKEV